MRPTVVVTVYPLLITVKSKPGYSGAPEKNRTPDIHITSVALYQLSYKGNIYLLILLQLQSFVNRFLMSGVGILIGIGGIPEEVLE